MPRLKAEIFLKNEATDLIDNKRSAPAEIGNEATVESSRQSAEGSRQASERTAC